jgi:hypothetical protein
MKNDEVVKILDGFASIVKAGGGIKSSSAERLKAAMDGLKDVNWGDVREFELEWEYKNMGNALNPQIEAFPLIRVSMR